MDPELLKSLKKMVNITIGVMVLIFIYLLFTYLMPLLVKIMAYLPVVLMPFIFAILLALLVEPVVNLFEKYVRLNRNWSVFFSLVLVIGGFCSAITLLLMVVIREMLGLYRLALAYSDQIITEVMAFLSDFKLFYIKLNLPPQVEDVIRDNLQDWLIFLQRLMNASIDGLLQGFASLPGILIFLVIATVATFFIIKDRALIRTSIINFLPPSARSKTRELIGELFRTLVGFIKAYSILVTITAVITMVALKIMGVKYALTIGMLTGLLDILPIVGTGVIMIPWMIWEFLS
ncbi:MAG: AI-2E family transporter, partial [Syntrophomonas sp.]|nr:AI-2E family transporter [Syntrophomonas sp.]